MCTRVFRLKKREQGTAGSAIRVVGVMYGAWSKGAPGGYGNTMSYNQWKGAGGFGKGKGKNTWQGPSHTGGNALQQVADMMMAREWKEIEDAQKAEVARKEEAARMLREAESKERKAELESFKDMFRKQEEKTALMMKSLSRRSTVEGDDEESRGCNKRARSDAGTDEAMEDWKAVLQVGKKKPVQRARAPIDPRQWTRWTADEGEAAKLKQELGCAANATALVGCSILEAAELLAEEYTLKNLKELHSEHLHMEAVARWSKVDIMAAIIAGLLKPK